MRLITKLAAATLLTALSSIACAQQLINCATGTPCNGSTVNTGTGDNLPTAGYKLNQDLTALYSTLQPALTGPVTTAGASNATSIGSNVLTNGMHAQMPADTVKCNPTGSTANVQDCTVSQMNTLLGTGAGGSGTVTSVSLTAPSWLTITGSPVTTTGTLAISATTGLTADEFLATPCAATGPVALRVLCASDMPAFSGAISTSAGSTVTTLGANVVLTGNIAAGAVTNSDIASSAVGTSNLQSNAVTNAILATMPAQTIKCNATGSTAAATDCTVSTINTLIGAGGSGGLTSVGLSAPTGFTVSSTPLTSNGTIALSYTTGLTANQFLATPSGSTGAMSLRSITAADMPAYTGQVTTPAGTTVNTIAANTVTNANLATAPTHTIKCNATGSTASETDCTVSTINTMLGTTSSSNPYVINFCTQSGVDPTGVTDSRAALVTALASSASGAAVIQVDCPVFLSYGAATTVSGEMANPGTDYTKPVFIPSGASIKMGPNGLFIVDNVTVNAFVFEDTTNAIFDHVNIEYIGHPGSVAISQTYGFGSTQPGLALNNTMVNYLTALWTSSSGVYGNKFTGSGAPVWNGPSAYWAVIQIRGAASNLVFRNLQVYAVPNAPATDFPLTAVQFSPDYIPGYLGASGTAITSTDYAGSSNSTIPTSILFDHPIFDGVQMGFVGQCGCHIDSPTFKRYADLQDGTGGFTYFNSAPASGATSATLSTTQYTSGQWPYETGTFALTMQLAGAVTAGTWVGTSGGTATVTFAGGGTVPVGQQVQIAGMTPSAYNGIFTVTASSSGSVSFLLGGTTATATVFGTISQIIYAPITAGATTTGTWNTPIVQAAASATQVSGNMGGVAHFTAPPHALYMDASSTYGALFNLRVDNALDYGQYVGQALRRSISGSGTLASLKWEAGYGSVINGWVTLRPDGCSDTLGSTNAYPNNVGAQLRNFYCVYDSRITGIDGTQTPGWRILQNGNGHIFSNVVFDNITLADVNPIPGQMPMATGGSYDNIAITNVREFLNDFSTIQGNQPTVLHQGNSLTETVEVYFNQYSSLGTSRGVADLGGNTFGSNQNVDIKLYGWMYRPVLFASVPAQGATTPPALATGTIVFASTPQSGDNQETLSTSTYPNGWTGATGAYYLTFGGGQTTVVQIAYGATQTGIFVNSPTSNATSATATWGGWPYNSCTCMVTLDDGRNTQVYIGLTNGSTATTGTFAALPDTANDAGAMATGMLQANFSSNVTRELIGANANYNSRIHLYDVTNNYDQLMEGGQLTEMWTQTWDGTPTSGSSQFTTPMIFPSTMAIDRKSLKIETALDTTTGSLTTIGVGFVGSGHATDLYSAVSPALNTNPYSNPATVNPAGGGAVVSTGANIDITPTSGTFGTTGVIKLSLRGVQTSAAN